MHYNHSKNYVKTYIQRHLAQGHALTDILEHLKKHNVGKELLYDVLHEMQLTQRASTSHHDEPLLTQKRHTKQHNNLLLELTVYDYTLILLLTGLFVLAIFTSLWTTVLLLFALFCVGYSYVENARWPIYSLMILAIIGFFYYATNASALIAALFLFLFGSVSVVVMLRH